MLRCVAAIFLLMASVGGPASAMDQSTMEETNCMMGCDANQENCLTGGQGPVGKTVSSARYSSPREMKSSPAIASRRTTKLPATYQATLAHPTDAKR